MSIYKAINSVMADLSKDGIGKDRNNAVQGYKFRGIDDVYNALSATLARHKLACLPRVLARECVERQSAKGNALFYVTVDVEYDLVAEDGTKHTVKVYGEAMDSGDKATNKAMSAAFKYMAMQVFCIPTEGDNDADNHTHEVQTTVHNVPKQTLETMDNDERKFLEGIATEVKEMLASGLDPDAAAHLEAQKLDAEEKVAIWALFDSKQRAAIKKANEFIKSQKAA